MLSSASPKSSRRAALHRLIKGWSASSRSHQWKRMHRFRLRRSELSCSLCRITGTRSKKGRLAMATRKRLAIVLTAQMSVNCATLPWSISFAQRYQDGIMRLSVGTHRKEKRMKIFQESVPGSLLYKIQAKPPQRILVAGRAIWSTLLEENCWIIFVYPSSSMLMNTPILPRSSLKSIPRKRQSMFRMCHSQCPFSASSLVLNYGPSRRVPRSCPRSKRQPTSSPGTAVLQPSYRICKILPTISFFTAI